jgi:hypothetical protein
MPIIINVAATRYRVIFSTLATKEKALLIIFMLKTIKNEKRITSSPVPSANEGGINKTSFDSKTSGIKIPKNNTPL